MVTGSFDKVTSGPSCRLLVDKVKAEKFYKESHYNVLGMVPLNGKEVSKLNDNFSLKFPMGFELLLPNNSTCSTVSKLDGTPDESVEMSVFQVNPAKILLTMSKW